MKKFYLIVSFVCLGAIANAQDAAPPDISEKKQQDIEALKVAFISKELDLTPDEAQKFWPVYNQYEKEIRAVIKDKDNDNGNILETEQRVLDIKKNYKDQFTKLLGNQQRVNRLYNAQNKFRQLLIKALQQRQLKRGLRNKPGLRN